VVTGTDRSARRTHARKELCIAACEVPRHIGHGTRVTSAATTERRSRHFRRCRNGQIFGIPTSVSELEPNRRVRIALISTPFVAVPPPRYGGTELIIHELAEGWTRRGQQVELFATGDSRTAAQLEWLYREAQWPPEVLTDLNHVSWCVEHILRGPSVDIIHAHSAAALACCRLVRDIPIVYTIHHAREDQLSSFYRHYPDVHYVAISSDQRHREVDLPHVEVIHHGLDPAPYHAVPTHPDEYVCFIGRFACVKGPHTAIDVARRARIAIRLAGEVHPPDQEWADAELKSRLAEPHVTYVGAVGLREKASLLGNARALLAPIEWHEPFGLVFIEAMLAGCPVVAFARGSVPELVENGVTGFAVSSVDDMVDVIRSGGAIESIDRARCRARAVERFSADRMVDDYLALFERLKRSPDSPGPRESPDPRMVA